MAETLRLRYPTKCWRCNADLAAGAQAAWDRALKRATCSRCSLELASGGFERGQAGRSALRRNGVTWKRGGEGEQLLGAALNELRAEGFAILHDRLIPGTRANIDHIAIGPAGIFVIDAKRYSGKVERRRAFSRDGRTERLVVGGRDRSKLLAGMERQVAAVRDTASKVPRIVPVICFVDSKWGLFASPLRFGEVRVVWPRALGKLLRSKGPLSDREIVELERELAFALPPA